MLSSIEIAINQLQNQKEETRHICDSSLEYRIVHGGNLNTKTEWTECWPLLLPKITRDEHDNGKVLHLFKSKLDRIN